MKLFLYLLQIVLTVYVINPWLYGDMFLYMEDTDANLYFNLLSVIILHPIRVTINEWLIKKVLTISVLDVYGFSLYMYYILPMAAFKDLHFFFVKNKSASLEESILYTLLSVSITYFVTYSLINFYKINHKQPIIEASFLEKIKPYRIYFDLLSAYFVLGPYIGLGAIMWHPAIQQITAVTNMIAFFWIPLMLLHEKKKWSKLYYIGIFILMAIPVIASTLLAKIIVVAFFITLLYIDKYKKIPWATLVIGGTVGMVFIGVKYAVRLILWNKSNVELSVGAKLKMWKLVITKLVVEQWDKFDVGALLGMQAERVSALWYLTRIIDNVPRRVPFWEWKSYGFMIYKFIPRMFWEDKPVDHIPNDIGHYVGWAETQDKETSWNVPHISESYISFGWYGLSVMVFYGLLLFFIIKLIYQSSHIIWKCFGIMLIYTIIRMEGHFALIYGNMHFYALFFVLILWLGNKKHLKNAG